MRFRLQFRCYLSIYTYLAPTLVVVVVVVRSNHLLMKSIQNHLASRWPKYHSDMLKIERNLFLENSIAIEDWRFLLWFGSSWAGFYQKSLTKRRCRKYYHHSMFHLYLHEWWMNHMTDRQVKIDDVGTHREKVGGFCAVINYEIREFWLIS